MAQILLVTAGSDTWEPTQEELKTINGMFVEALMEAKEGHSTVLTARNGVTAKIIDSSEVDGVKVVTAHCEDLSEKE